MDSIYDDAERIRRAVELGQHRQIIGGLWDEVGDLQIDFMRRRGLEPHHRLLDVGCGSLRGGVRFVEYLEPGHYYGLDINEPLLDAGYDREIGAAGLQDRLPRENLICDGEFDVALPDAFFDFIVAQSVFTHVSCNRIRECLEKMAPKIKDGGIFFATFFEISEDAPASRPAQRHGEIVSHGAKDPFHYRVSDLHHAASCLPWEPVHIGDWSHPRGQNMMAFVRRRRARTPVDASTRALPTEAANLLEPGADHYRAYVGPPDRYDFMSGTQFSLLFACGLREHHRVLDFGCGSLRLGRLLLPFLRERCYFGIEPNHWLIEDSVDHEIGRDIVRLKKPSFSDDEGFNCSVLGTVFDFIIAQSILTHCGPDLFDRLLDSARASLTDDGLLLFSIIRTADEDTPPPADGWHYPQCVAYTDAHILERCEKAGLAATSIPWYHPGAAWYAAARSVERLPSERQKSLLRGVVLHDPQFGASSADTP